ncbi:MAG: protease modulator HflK, partial [Planctomycetes bacterium]|nr:protease modulator HflK [Planctomycetota bacterium]
MNSESSVSKDRRAQLAALVGFIFQTVFFIVLFVVGSISESDVILAAARFMLGGVVIWPVISIVYSQRRRMAKERLDAEELKHSRAADGVSAIFDSEDEAYLIEKRRLAWILRWLVPSTALLVAMYHITASIWVWGWSFGKPLSDNWSATKYPGPSMAFVGGIGFLSFLFSRYTAGMARMSGWRLLRSGASFLAGNALACLLVLIAIGLQGRDLPNPEALVTYILRIALLVLGIEFIANFVLDFYRPRAIGQESRPAFDSRLLALVTETGGIARSLADAINYQFGFEVSTTWFYQLLKRAMIPMAAFGVVALLALSTIVIVDADEQAIVERFGKKLQGGDSVLSPGLHIKSPWPIDSVYRARVEQVRTLTIGTATDNPEIEDRELDDEKKKFRPILWGEKHEFNAEMMLMVASPDVTNFESDSSSDLTAEDEEANGGEREGKAVAVGLLMVSVDIQYRIKDLHDYLYRFQDPERLVEAIAYQVLTDYAASVDVDRIIGPGRGDINASLHSILQARADELGLGIEILFCGVQEAHPTDDVAKSFQEVVKAELEMESHIEEARGQAEQILTSVAGSRNRALRLDRAILEMDRLAKDDTSTAEAMKAAEARVDALLLGATNSDKVTVPAGGMAASKISRIRARVLFEATQAKRDLTVFSAEKVAFKAAPELYKVRKYLEMLQRALVHVRKYVVVTSSDKKIIVIYDKPQTGTIDIDTE